LADDDRPAPVSHGTVDAHLHLWDPNRLAIGWLADAADAPRLNRPIEHHDYATAARPLGVEAAVIVEAAVDDEAIEDEVTWMCEHVAAAGLVAAGVAGWRPAGDAGRVSAWLERLAATPGIVGVREVLHAGAMDATAPADRRRISAVQRAGECGLVVDICARPDQLRAVETLVTAAPGTTFVLDHLGRPRSGASIDAAWRDSIDRIAAVPNVVVKISALIECAENAAWTAEGFRPFIQAVLDAFGPVRAMWGSNWPMCVDDAAGLAGWLDAARFGVFELSEGEQAQVFAGTARRVYGLAAD
jgi:L-fuconolactonase